MAAVKIDLSGGLEGLFGNQKEFVLQLDQQMTLKQLVHHFKDKHLQARPELFLSGDNVRPGILVLVNETDWELCGKENYVIQDRDSISFISTLHGG